MFPVENDLWAVVSKLSFIRRRRYKMSKYNFYYDESEHSRKINYKTVSASNYYDNFVTMIVGWSAEKNDILQQHAAFETRYVDRKDRNGEIKSTMFPQKQFKYGFASLNKQNTQFLNDFLSLFDEDIHIYFSVSSKIEYLVLQLFQGYRNSFLIDADLMMSFDGFNKYLQEKDIQNYSLIIDKEGESKEESKTLKSAREIGLDNSDEADSTEHPGLRMADMMVGIISKLLKGLCDSLRYQSLDESINKKILDVGWFCLNEIQLELYKKLYRLICEWQPAWYKSYSGIYSDDLVVFNALLNFMSHFESVEQLRANIDMQGEYFNAFACEQLARYFDQRRCKLPIEPVIPFDEESYLNERGGKVYFDSRKQRLLPLYEGSQIFDVLSVGVDQKFTPTVTILKDGESECFRLPNELSEWACSVIGMAAMGMNLFPAKVIFSNVNGRYYADIL